MKLKPKVIIEETPIAKNTDLEEVSDIVNTIATVEKNLKINHSYTYE